MVANFARRSGTLLRHQHGISALTLIVLPCSCSCKAIHDACDDWCLPLQENVQLVKSDRGIRHRAIDSYFSSFNPHLDR